MNCIICKKPIESAKKNVKYCSNACKQEAFRQRHGLSKPSFLASSKAKPTTSRKETKQVETKKVAKREVDYNVEEKLAVYVQKLRSLDGRIAMLNNEKKKLNDKIASLNTKQNLLSDSIQFATMLDKTSKEVLGKGVNPILTTLLGAAINRDKNYEGINRRNSVRIKLHQYKIKDIDVELNKLLQEKSLANYQYQILSNEFKRHVENYLEAKYAEEKELEQLNEERQRSQVYTLNDIKDTEFAELLDFGKPLSELIGLPTKTFKALVYGVSGQGKTTWTLNFANMFAEKFGTVLFNSSEEGISHSLRRKLYGYTSENLFFSEAKTFEDLKSLLLIKKYDLVVIDSLNDMKISQTEFDELQGFKNAFIFISQATKDGNYKGGTKFAHDSDIILKISNYEPEVEKTRFK